MRTFIPRIPDKPSRLIAPSVNGASKPAVPVSFLTPPVMQTVMPPATQPVKPFQINPSANAPVQFALGEARDWVKDNSDKTDYPTGWTNGKNDLPLASKIKAYIENKGDGWQDLKTQLDAPKRKKAPGKRAAKGASAAASTSGSTSGSSTSTSTSTSSSSSTAAQKWQERKKKLSDKVDAANEAIKKASSSLTEFYTKRLELPANIRVQIKSLLAVSNLKLDKEHSRLAYFSTSLLEITKEASKKKAPTGKKKKASAGKKTKASPEIQTAIIEESKTNALSLEISGNNSGVNSLLAAAFLGDKTLEQGYTETIRPHHVKRKAATLEKNVKKKKLQPQQVKRLRLTKLPAKPKIGDFKKDTANNLFVGPGSSHTPDEFKEMITTTVAYDLHTSTKKEAQNQQRKGARNFVKKHRGKALSTARVRVPENKRNIHAESAILEDLSAQADKAIVAVGGTKVACTACQAYYTKLKQEALLGDNTSFAWLSESSINQLGFDADKVTEYLLEIKRILNARLARLRFFEGKSGTFGEEHLLPETDVDTDSEDEEGIALAAKSTVLSEVADGVISLL